MFDGVALFRIVCLLLCTRYMLTVHNVLDNVKIGNLKRKNRDHKKVPKQDEDAGTCKFYYI